MKKKKGVNEWKKNILPAASLQSLQPGMNNPFMTSACGGGSETYYLIKKRVG